MLALDSEIDADACVGTFRWSKSKVLPSLASLEVVRKSSCYDVSASKDASEDDRQNKDEKLANVQEGWSGFLAKRCGHISAVEKARNDLSLIDGLSYPLTAIFALEKLRPLWHNVEEIDLIIMGATYKAEVRLLRETSYWGEIQRHFHGYGKTCRLWFVGPELEGPFQKNDTAEKPSRNQHKGKNKHTQLQNCWQGGIKDFLMNTKPELVRQLPFAKSATLLIGFNPGFGSGAPGLLESWFSDLEYIRDTRLPCIFTQANDFSDVRGELLILRSLLKVSFLLAPARNPFYMAMTACADPSHPESSSWSCGNSFYYAFCGMVPGLHPEHISTSRLRVCRQLCERFHGDVTPFNPHTDVHLNKIEMVSVQSLQVKVKSVQNTDITSNQFEDVNDLKRQGNSYERRDSVSQSRSGFENSMSSFEVDAATTATTTDITIGDILDQQKQSFLTKAALEAGQLNTKEHAIVDNSLPQPNVGVACFKNSKSRSEDPLSETLWGLD